jgi:hypothetical protein
VEAGEVSRANLYVLFPDGTVRYGIYNGTSDIALPFLVATPGDAWDTWESSDYDWTPEPAPVNVASVPVDVATDYGSGFSWKGWATHDRLTLGHEPDIGYSRERPAWARSPR